MHNIITGFFLIFSGFMFYLFLGLMGVILSVIGEDIAKKIGLEESFEPFSVRNISLALLAISVTAGILYVVGFLWNLVVNLF